MPPGRAQGRSRRPCGNSGAGGRRLRARLVAELGDGAACGELVPCVVRRQGRRLPIARFLQFDQTGAGCCERLSGADPEPTRSRPGADPEPTRSRPGADPEPTRSECPETRLATPASAARLVMIERIDRAPRRPVTVAPSFSTWRNNGPPVVMPAALSHAPKRCMVGAPR